MAYKLRLIDTFSSEMQCFDIYLNVKYSFRAAVHFLKCRFLFMSPHPARSMSTNAFPLINRHVQERLAAGQFITDEEKEKEWLILMAVLLVSLFITTCTKQPRWSTAERINYLVCTLRRIKRACGGALTIIMFGCQSGSIFLSSVLK